MRKAVLSVSAKERVIRIIDSWTEKQLEGFLVMFDEESSEISETDDEEIRRKCAAHEEIKKLRKKVPDDFDYDKELAGYREEKYGI